MVPGRDVASRTDEDGVKSQEVDDDDRKDDEQKKDGGGGKMWRDRSQPRLTEKSDACGRSRGEIGDSRFFLPGLSLQL